MDLVTINKLIVLGACAVGLVQASRTALNNSNSPFDRTMSCVAIVFGTTTLGLLLLMF